MPHIAPFQIIDSAVATKKNGPSKAKVPDDAVYRASSDCDNVYMVIHCHASGQSAFAIAFDGDGKYRQRQVANSNNI